jgi:hypothetical protein
LSLRNSYKRCHKDESCAPPVKPKDIGGFCS